MSSLRLLLLVGLGLLVPSPSTAVCPCDCNGDGGVRVNEIIQSIEIALGNSPVGSCPSAGLCSGERVCITSLVRCVDALLNGCDAPPRPTATPTIPATTPTPTSTPSSTFTSTPTGPVAAAMRAVFDESCHPFGIVTLTWLRVEDGLISYQCSESPGHDSDGELLRYANSEAARGAFEEIAAYDDGAAWASESFHDLPALYREASDGGTRFFRESFVWQLDCWLVRFNSFDDTHFTGISPQPRPLSETVYELARDALLNDCR